MTALNQLYQCKLCGNIVEVLHTGRGTLVCCGQPMHLLEEQTGEEEGREKHVPVVEQTASGVKVVVGSVPHPMQNRHYIEWVEVLDGDHTCRRRLLPGDAPEAEFQGRGARAAVRAYCNLHGLWRAAN